MARRLLLLNAAASFCMGTFRAQLRSAAKLLIKMAQAKGELPCAPGQVFANVHRLLENEHPVFA
jgi:hypothetical protein